MSFNSESGPCLKFINYIEKNYGVTHGKKLITYNPHLIALGSIYNDVINSDVVLIVVMIISVLNI